MVEIDVEKVLEHMNLSYNQFVDLCIMCGCDYCDTIKGIGPKSALKLIKEHKNIETAIAHLKKNDKKKVVPPDWKEHKVSRKAMEAAMQLKEQLEKEKEEKEIAEARALKEAVLAANSMSASGDASSTDITTAGDTVAAQEGHGGTTIHTNAPSAYVSSFDAGGGSSVAGFSAGGDETTAPPTGKGDDPATITMPPAAPVDAVTVTVPRDRDEDSVLLDSDGENKTPHADKDAEKDEDDKENADNSASVPPVDEVAEDEDEEIAEDDVEIVPPIFMQARDLFLGAPSLRRPRSISSGQGLTRMVYANFS